MQADGGNIGMVHTANAVFPAIVFLIGCLPNESAQRLAVQRKLGERGMVVYLLVGIAYLAAERREVNRLSELHALLQQLLVAHLRALHDAQLLAEIAISQFRAPPAPVVAQIDGSVVFAHSGIVQ